MTQKQYAKLFIKFLKKNNAYKGYIMRMKEDGLTLKWLLKAKRWNFLSEAFDWGKGDEGEDNYSGEYWSYLSEDWIYHCRKQNT